LGGVGALQEILPALPATCPVPILVTQHGGDAGLARVLDWRAQLSVGVAHTGDGFRQSGVSVVPPGVGLEPATATVGPPRFDHAASSSRPCDQVLTAAAAHFGRGLIAVVLTGRLDDAARGVRATKRAGGRVIVQDPLDAAAPGMPTAAMATGCVDFVLPLARIACALIALTMAPGGAHLLAVAPSSWAAYA
jgi:two-component system, chemotaxis family, protein-glutamate methylesterase/glutaminase